MKIQFLYFDGCPNSEPTLNNLKEALLELGMQSYTIQKILIKNEEDSKNHNFLGSPSIYLKDIDIYTGQIPNKNEFTCRIYNFDGINTGIIPKDFIIKKIREYF